jgi:hypothetical protein
MMGICGIDTAKYQGHALRGIGASMRAALGQDSLSIMSLMRLSSAHTFKNHYLRLSEELEKDNSRGAKMLQEKKIDIFEAIRITALDTELIGSKVRKKYGREWFEGTVVGFTPSLSWWFIKYDDRDKAEYNVKELSAITQGLKPFTGI